MTDISSLKDSYSSSKAIIIGNGPSLKQLDLGLLSKNNIVSFAVNRISLSYDKTNWRPDFYFCFSSNYKHKEWKNDIKNACLQKETKCFVHKDFRSFLPEQENIFFVDVFEHYRHSSIPDDLFSISPEKHFLKSYSATVSAYQLCFYMGIKNIGIIGQDGYVKEKQNHFDERYKFDPSNFEKTNNRIIRLHKVIKKYCDEHGIKIQNFSKSCIIEEYPITEIMDFLKE